VAEITLPPGMSPEDLERILKSATKKKVESTGQDYVEFAKIDYGNGQELHVYRDVYKGREMFSIRRFYQDDAGETKPAKGVTFHDEDIDEIVEGLEKMKVWLGEHSQVGTKQFEQGDS